MPCETLDDTRDRTSSRGFSIPNHALTQPSSPHDASESRFAHGDKVSRFEIDNKSNRESRSPKKVTFDLDNQPPSVSNRDTSSVESLVKSKRPILGMKSSITPKRAEDHADNSKTEHSETGSTQMSRADTSSSLYVERLKPALDGDVNGRPPKPADYAYKATHPIRSESSIANKSTISNKGEEIQETSRKVNPRVYEVGSGIRILLGVHKIPRKQVICYDPNTSRGELVSKRNLDCAYFFA